MCKIITLSAELLQKGALCGRNSSAVLRARQIIQHPHSLKSDNYFDPNISDFNSGHTFLQLFQENCTSLYKKFVCAVKL